MTTFNEEGVQFEGVIYEDDVRMVRDRLSQSAPTKMIFDFTACEDIHTSVLQLVLSYDKQYKAEYKFGPTSRMYQKVIEGFSPVEDDCYQ